MPSSQLTDFPDRLSPMIVKELRQGLRTNLFTTSFILLQGFMVLTVFIGAAAEGEAGVVSGFFWFFMAATLLFAMPVRGFSSLSSEQQMNTMDLIQLTRLSAWRITFGKWAALMSQTSLLVVSILPYLVMRYFFGGIDLIQEFLLLCSTFFGSALLTALTVGFSAFKSVLLRGFVVVATGFVLLSVVPSFLFSRMYLGRSLFSSGITNPGFWWGALAVVLAGLYIIYFLLDFGASQIAPLSENHAIRKRLVALVFMLALLSLAFAGIDEKLVAVLATVAIVPAWVDAITERPAIVPRVLRPFAANRIYPAAKYLLTPGWHTGIIYLVFTAPILIAWLFFMTPPPASIDLLEQWALFTSILGTITYPLIFIHLFIPKGKQMLGLYILIQCCTFLIAFLIALVSEAVSNLGGILYYCFPVPAVSLFAISENNSPSYFLLASVIFILLSLVIPFWRALPLYKQMRLTTKTLAEENPPNLKT